MPAENAGPGDLRSARDTLHATGASVVAVLGGRVIGQAVGEGLRPLLQLIDAGQVQPGCAVADRVVGLAAAKLMTAAGVAAVYAPLGSLLAVDWLRAAGVGHEFDQVVPAILRRDRQGECPMERLARGTDDIRAALARQASQAPAASDAPPRSMNTSRTLG